MASTQAHAPVGPPYAPPTAALGGQPTIPLDVPICAVFILLYVVAAAAHMTILQLNLRKGHKFIMSGLMFGFCMARILTCTMRIVWATRPTNVRIAMAASILVSAGVLILFLINIIFAQRIVRAVHPHFGWHKFLQVVFMIIYLSIALMLAVIITVIVQSYYTLNANTHRIDRDIQLTVATYFAFLSFLPIPMVILGLIVPRKTPLEKFGSGRWRTKVQILLAAATVLCLGTAFRAGTSFKTPRPRNDPPWYFAKWCFYFFNFVLEIIVIYMYVIVRVDRRFHIPDGSSGPGDYLRHAYVKEPEKPQSAGSERRIMSEEEVFDDEIPDKHKEIKDTEADVASRHC